MPAEVFAAAECQITELNPQNVYDLRVSHKSIQILVVTLVALALGFAILIIARRHLISFRYTIGWLGLCAVTFLGALLVPVVEPVARFLKVDPFTVVGGSAFLILLGICIQLSISISGLQRQLHDVNEVVALLRDKVENDSAR
jgi:asparagine N-glycosylation enzyme membrane subunit Stt3